MVCLFFETASYLLGMIRVVNISIHEIVLCIILFPLVIHFVFFSRGVLAALMAVFFAFSFCYFFIAKDIKYIKKMFVWGVIIAFLGFILRYF